MKIIVTGSTGFIGKHFLSDLKKNTSHEIIPLTREIEPKNLPSFFEKAKADAVVHLATLFLKNHTYDQIEPLCISNLTYTTQLLDCAKKSGVSHFIHFGSYWQFTEGTDGKLQSVAASLYSASKAAVEPILDYYAVQQNLRVTQLYLYDTYGPNDPRPKITNLMIQTAKSGEPLKLSPGHQTFKLLHVQDVCSAIQFALQSSAAAAKTPAVSRFAIEPADTCTLRELAKKIETGLGKKIDAQWGIYEYPKGIPMIPTIPHPPLPGWKAQINLDQGLVELMKT